MSDYKVPWPHRWPAKPWIRALRDKVVECRARGEDVQMMEMPTQELPPYVSGRYFDDVVAGTIIMRWLPRQQDQPYNFHIVPIADMKRMGFEGFFRKGSR